MSVRNRWNQYTLKRGTYLNTLTKELFVPIATPEVAGQPTGLYGHAKLRDAMSDSASASTLVPDDFVSLVSVKALVWSSSTGNFRWQGTVDLYTEGEYMWTFTYNIPPATSIITVGDTLFALDITDAFSEMSVGDFVGIDFGRRGAHAEDTIADFVYVIGFVIEYIASQ